jgi:hypothetical protein
MAKFGLDILCGINIDKDTADLALKIVNIYCNKNDLCIKETPDSDSTNVKMIYIARDDSYYNNREENK